MCQIPALMAELEAKRVSFQAKADALYTNNVNVKVPLCPALVLV